jgi:Tfp pilus assembly protein PilF
MGLVIVMLVIVVGAGWFTWRRRRYRQAHTLRVSSQSRPHENVAHKAFVHGNTCLREGKFDEARVAFHQALELDPKHPHSAARLAEVDRQGAACAVAPAHTTC